MLQLLFTSTCQRFDCLSQPWTADVIGSWLQAKFNKWFPMKSLNGQQQLLWQTRGAPPSCAAPKFTGNGFILLQGGCKLQAYTCSSHILQ